MGLVTDALHQSDDSFSTRTASSSFYCTVVRSHRRRLPQCGAIVEDYLLVLPKAAEERAGQRGSESRRLDVPFTVESDMCRDGEWSGSVSLRTVRVTCVAWCGRVGRMESERNGQKVVNTVRCQAMSIGHE